ncbi:MAG: zinc-dependent alcohol dehydrogenase family protein [Candidatus Hodarchaeota archaeon]
MKAMQFENPFTVKLREIKISELGKNDLLIKVGYTGICGTDLHIYEGKNPFVKFPIIPGHEFSGTITAVGSSVMNFVQGENVSINPNLSCIDLGLKEENYCFYCKRVRPHFCKNWKAIGVTVNGAFAEYVVCPSTSAYRIPENVSLKEAVFMEPIACCLHGIYKLKITSGSIVLIIGAGPIGLLMVSLIKSLYNSHIIVIEPRISRRNLAKLFGANLIIDPINESLNEVIETETEGNGVDFAIEAVGSRVTSYIALEFLNKGGKALIFGVSKPMETIVLNLFELYNKEISLIGSFTNPYENNDAMKILQNKSINISKLISHELPLEKLEEGLQLLKRGLDNAIKILIRIEDRI